MVLTTEQALNLGYKEGDKFAYGGANYSFTPEGITEAPQQPSSNLTSAVETSQAAKDALAKANLLYTKETTPASPVEPPKEPAKLSEQPKYQDAGTLPTGEKLFMLPSGEILTASQIQAKQTPSLASTDKQRIETEAKNNIDSTIEALDNLKKISSANHQRLIESIEASTARAIRETNISNRSLIGTITTAGFRSGLAQYAPEMQASRIAYEVQQGVQRIQDLETKKNSLIAEADVAQTKEDYEAFFKKMELVRKINEDKTTQLKNLEESTLAREKAVREKAEELRKQAEEGRKKAEAIAPVLADYLTGDQTADMFLIKTVAQSQGVNPLDLLGHISKYSNEQEAKINTPDIREFKFGNDELAKKGLPPLTWKEFQDQQQAKKIQQARAQAEVRSEYRIPSQAEQTVATYAARLEQANPILKDLESKIQNMNFANYATQIRSPFATFQTATIQQYMQASRNLINAVLRRESGAVISPDEFSEARKQYLPEPGDSDLVLKQKENNRNLVYESLKKAGGKAYQSVNELIGTQPDIKVGKEIYQYNPLTKKYGIRSK